MGHLTEPLFSPCCVQPFPCAAHGSVQLCDCRVYPPRPSVPVLQAAESKPGRPPAVRSHCQVSGHQEHVSQSVGFMYVNFVSGIYTGCPFVHIRMDSEVSVPL